MKMLSCNCDVIACEIFGLNIVEFDSKFCCR